MGDKRRAGDPFYTPTTDDSTCLNPTGRARRIWFVSCYPPVVSASGSDGRGSTAVEKAKPNTTRIAAPAPPADAGNAALLSLLRLYPRAAAMNVNIDLRLPSMQKGHAIKSRILFGASDTVIFSVDLPLKCGETLLLKSQPGAAEAPATVVAAMPDEKGAIVAVRFCDGNPGWYAPPSGG